MGKEILVENSITVKNRIKDKNKKIKIVSVIVIVIAIIFSLGSINEFTTKIYIKNQIKINMKQSELNKFITKSKINGYFNSVITLYVNDSFNDLSNEEKASKLNLLLLNIDSTIHDFTVGHKKIKIDFIELSNNEKIYVNSSKGKYTYTIDTSKLPSGECLKLPNGNLLKFDNTTIPSSTNNTNVYNTPMEPSNYNKAFAWTATIDIVKQNLASPSSAVFPSDEDIKETDINTFTVKSYVDSENSFGATIRSNFSVTIIKNGNSFSYKDLSINSK